MDSLVVMVDSGNEAPVIRFQRGWSHSVQGDLHAGSVLLVDYDFDRLPNCRGERLGVPSWQIDVHVRFHPGGHGQQHRLTGSPLELKIPRGATQIEMWFRNWDARFCQAYDSRFGENYWFDVRP